MSAAAEGCLFKFWEGVSASTKVHPKDEAVFETYGKQGLNLECLPNPFYGPLRTAPIVLLYLNPGFSEKDRSEAESEEGRQFYWRQRHGNEPLRSQINLEKKSWWVSRTKHFCADPEYLRHKLAVLQLCAYHSKEFKDWPLIAALPSSRVAISWAQKELFADAQAGKRVVICLRSPRYWGLTPGQSYGRTLFAPLTTRNGHIQKSGGMLNAIRGAVHEILNENRVNQ